MEPPDFDEAFEPDSWSVEVWAEVPQPVRNIVEQHVAAHLPAKTLSVPTARFFHFGGGMTVRNLCRQRLTDDELAAHCPFGGDWDNFYIGVLAAIAAAPVRRSGIKGTEF